MPLVQGNSQEAIHKNIKRLIDEGKPKDQAVAIAYNVAQDADLKKLAELFDQWLKEESKEPAHAMDESENRYIDNNGHLIVKRTVITKAAVNPYRGSEIPDSERLGLDPNKIYYLLRCPVELERGMSTFSAIQLLLRHIPVDAKQPQKESTVGAIGSEFEMDDDGRVWAMLRVHDQEGIDYIQSGKMQELSAGYAYTPDMTAGVYNGEYYDGIMRNIQGNHVAIVERGRIGRDAIVADYMPNEIEDYLMTKQVKIKQGSLEKLQAKLGMDSLDSVKDVILAVHGALALDSDDKAEDEEEVVEVAEDEQTQADKDNESEAMRLKEREKREEKDRERDKKEAEDEDDKPKKAMDADSIRRSVVELFEAREKVKPIVGQIACDSAEEVYKTALKQIGVSTAGVHPSAFGAMVDMHLAGSQRATIAQDSAPSVMSSSLSTLTKHIR